MATDARNRLQPALLDRLTDDAPEHRVESEDHRVMSKSQLRQAVLRDLSALFNAVQPLGVGAAPYPQLRGSVLNFGLPPLAGGLASKLDVSALEGAIRQAIVDFEPRILGDTLWCARSRRAASSTPTTSSSSRSAATCGRSRSRWRSCCAPSSISRPGRSKFAMQSASRRRSRAEPCRRHDPRLLRLYSDELTHLREVGAEFADAFPKIASRLGMEGMEVTDPYVERLLEGFAFLTARIQLKLEAEHPRLIAHLLEATYPNFLAPVPSMAIARLQVDPRDPNLVNGYPLPRGSALTSEAARGQDTHCEFRTAQALTLWPIEIVAVQAFTHAPDPATGAAAPGAWQPWRPAHPPAVRRRHDLSAARDRPPAALPQRGADVAFRLTSGCSAPPPAAWFVR
jgi:predicted component of type VI protein secretion system